MGVKKNKSRHDTKLAKFNLKIIYSNSEVQTIFLFDSFKQVA